MMDAAVASYHNLQSQTLNGSLLKAYSGSLDSSPLRKTNFHEIALAVLRLVQEVQQEMAVQLLLCLDHAVI